MATGTKPEEQEQEQELTEAVMIVPRKPGYDHDTGEFTV